MKVGRGKKKKEREILLTLVFSCLVIDLHALLVVTLRAVQRTYAHIQYGERKCKRESFISFLVNSTE